MASIYDRYRTFSGKPARWYAVFKDEHGRRVKRSTGTSSKREARMIAHEWERRAQRLGRRFMAKLAWDSNERAVAVYEQNLKPTTVRTDDIGAILGFTPRTCPTNAEQGLIAAVGAVDVVVAGPPCQGHSDLNNHTRRDDDRNGLYETVARFVELARPELVLVENVRSVTRDRRGHAAAARRRLEEAGYFVSEGTVNLATLGVPQARTRHLMIAARDAKLPALEDLLAAYRVGEARSVGWAISGLEDAASVAATDFMNRMSRLSADNRRRIDHLFDNDLFDLPDAARPACHRDKPHTYRSMYGRLDWDQPAQTITTGFSSPGQGRYIHPTCRRTLTPREAARLQFFPDWFDFAAAETRASAAKMIGNAVPPRLAEVVILAAYRAMSPGLT